MLEQQFVGCGQPFNRILQVSAGFSTPGAPGALRQGRPAVDPINGIDLNASYRVTSTPSSPTAATISPCSQGTTASAAPWTPMRSRTISPRSRRSRRARRIASPSCRKVAAADTAPTTTAVEDTCLDVAPLAVPQTIADCTDGQHRDESLDARGLFQARDLLENTRRPPCPPARPILSQARRPPRRAMPCPSVQLLAMT